MQDNHLLWLYGCFWRILYSYWFWKVQWLRRLRSDLSPKRVRNSLHNGWHWRKAFGSRERGTSQKTKVYMFTMQAWKRHASLH